MPKVRVKIPQKIKLACLTYDIYFDRNLEKDGNLGYHKGRKQELLVNPNIKDEQKMVTILHEVIHVSKGVWVTRLSDADVDRVANCLATFLDGLGIEFDWSDVPTKQEEL